MSGDHPVCFDLKNIDILERLKNFSGTKCYKDLYDKFHNSIALENIPVECSNLLPTNLWQKNKSSYSMIFADFNIGGLQDQL